MGATDTLGGGRTPRGAGLESSTATSVAIIAVTVLAAVARFREYFGRRSLWFDEAAVAMNIVQRSFGQLLRPLDNEQTAGPFFLWAERVAYLIGGNNELALRTLPLIAGLLLPLAMFAVARRLLPRVEAVIAAALIGLAPLVVYYANEIKPYGMDALMTVLLFLAALRVEEKPDSRWRWVELALGGAVAIGFSIPAPLVLAGVALFLLLKPEVRRAPGVLANAGIVVGAWVVATAFVLMVYQPLVRHDSYIGGFMQHYWESTFLTNEPPGLKERAGTAIAGATRNTFLDGVIWPQQSNMILVLALAGLVRIARSRGVGAAAMLAVPIGLLVVAAALKMYPLGERVILFASPITALLVVAGFTWPAQVFRGTLRTGAAVLAGVLLLLIPATHTFGGMQKPLPGRAETRDLIREVARARSETPRPVVWISAGSVMSWRYYAGPMAPPMAERKPGMLPPQPDSVDSGVLIGKWSQSDVAKRQPDWGMYEIDRMRASGTPCGYMFLSNLENNERPQLVSAIERSGSRIADTRTAQGVEVLHVCFRQT